MKLFPRTFSLLTLVLITSISLFADAVSSRADEILKQARAALGDAERLRSVQSLSFKGKFRRQVQGMDVTVEGEREFDLLLPDKFMRTDTMVAGGLGTSITTYQTLNGDDSWRGGYGGGGMIVMRGDNKELSKEQKEKIESEMATRRTREMRGEYARYLLALLFTASPSMPLEFAYAGEAVADDGRADVLDVKGADGFAARLFLDKETHLPLMLTYRAPKQKGMTVMRAQRDGKTPEQMIKEARERAMNEAATKPEEVEMQMRFSDYRKTNGLLMPYRIAFGSEGATSEEIEVKSYTINPQFKADKFEKK